MNILSVNGILWSMTCHNITPLLSTLFPSPHLLAHAWIKANLLLSRTLTPPHTQRCINLIPSLSGAPILDAWSRLRPTRESVRIELEAREGKPLIVHNYGTTFHQRNHPTSSSISLISKTDHSPIPLYMFAFCRRARGERNHVFLAKRRPCRGHVAILSRILIKYYRLIGPHVRLFILLVQIIVSHCFVAINK